MPKSVKMVKSQSRLETQKRINIIRQINNYVKNSTLSGLLVTGSIAWGKNNAVTDISDIDFYLLAPSIESFRSSLINLPAIPQETKAIFNRMLNYKQGLVDTRSMKTDIGPYYGTIYLFVENDLARLTRQFDNSDSKFFKNLRPHDKPQTKEYKGFKGNKLVFTTPISQVNLNTRFWIRTDPLFLTEANEFFGSIFLSHLLFGEIYTDKQEVICSAKKKARQFLKSLLPKQKKDAYVLFQNYLPRIEKMSKKTISNLFNSIWLS